MSRSEEHTSELQSPCNLVCRLLLEKKKKTTLLKVFSHRTLITLTAISQPYLLFPNKICCCPYFYYLMCSYIDFLFFFFFFNATATPEIYTLSLHDALPISAGWPLCARAGAPLYDPMCGSGTPPIEA